MTSTSFPKKRVESRKQELIATLGELKHSTAEDAAAMRDAMRKRVSDIARTRMAGWLEN
jgi:hypothetical protein